jgi:hypothetical protein
MKTEIGLWIDHKKAVVVSLTERGTEINQIQSNVEKQVRLHGGARMKTSRGALFLPAEDRKDRQFAEHLNKYYGAVISRIRQAGSILIFGPGEAKFELEKRIRHQKLKGQIIGIENADKMTERQIAAKVRKHFEA